MTEKKITRIIRPATAEERTRHAEVRRQIEQEFPPKVDGDKHKSPPGIPAQIRHARESQGLTRYALAKLAGIPNTNTIRDIESGRDAQISTVQSLTKALGLRLDLVEETV